MKTENLIIPSEIPWEEIKGKALEELLYWLLDSMGAKDLEWRIGGKGNGTADQGRDLECVFYTQTPEGELLRESWWIESKGRVGKVEPDEVKGVVLNVAGKASVDVLVIATNSNFSNPTRDWVKEWQRGHPRPIIKLWERTELEKFCSKFPTAVMRLYSKALSTQGRLEVVRSRFWNYALLADAPTLEALWSKHEVLISPEALAALITSEAGNGSLSKRPWGMRVDPDTLGKTLINSLLNLIFLVFRAGDIGVRQEPFIKALSYQVLCAMDRLGSDYVATLLKEWNFDDRALPQEIKELILGPVIDTLVTEIRDVCTSDCSRVMTSPLELSERDIELYWFRLSTNGSNENKKEKVLSMESLKTPCKVGFCVSEEVGCPVNGDKYRKRDTSKLLFDIKKIVDFRKSEITKSSPSLP